ncbi:Hypothetical predicted protein [Paramuricea clavata]|uniref:Uncharacterized protein n=1 Tax=Paramuricea clavata TaxID=317549 RepID=A0A6S7GIP8_PARCT|nr:Hypothetical predicted protein [Paramuricea clavata]
MPQKKPQTDVTDENEIYDRLHKKINELGSDPSLCEGKIRELHRTILTVKNNGKKEQLLTELKASSFKGLSLELSKLVKEDGLTMESLHLVLKYLTKKNELAEYLFVTSTEIIEQDGLDPVRRRLGPKLEVLGGLLSKGIDVNKEWVQNLLKNAPSQKTLARISVTDLEKYCEKATPREMEDVSQIVRVAESQSIEKPSDDQTQVSIEQNTSNKAVDKEKLEQAKSLMNEAKKIAKEESEAAKKAVNEKMSEISKLLELPPDWNKQETGKTPEKLLEELNGIINLFNNAVEPNEPYNSDHEVVQKASGGRALCGIFFSKYRASSTAERPLIIMPSKVMLSSPNNSHQIRYLKFSASRAAANYVQTVKSSSTNVGFSVGGFYELFVGDVHGSYGSSHETNSAKLEKETTSQASVVQYIWTATKTFKIEQEQFILSASARKHAKMLAKVIQDEEEKQVEKESDEEKKQAEKENDEEEKQAERLRSTDLAKKFLDRYGSHMPAGLHTLGGVLFRIVDAQSEGKSSAYQLTEKAAQQLQGQLSFGFLGGAFGIGMSVSGEHSSSEGKKTAQEEKEEKTSYTFTSQAMGPAATDPATFSKLLGNNSTWALIDRGSPSTYIPVWEMINDLGSEFEKAAQVLQNAWNNKEMKLKKQSRRLGKELTKIVVDDLVSFKNESLKQKPDEIGYGFLPNNGAQLVFNRTISTINLTPETAYKIAGDKIIEDPRHRVCAVSLCPDGKYMVRCWEASDAAEMTFESAEGKHQLLYSQIIFKWKDNVPQK